MKQSKAYHLTIRSLFIALIIIQSLVPFLGYIPLGVTNLTIIQVTVIIAGVVLGPRDGLWVGFSWGLIKLFMAYTAPSSLMDTLVFQNPIITIIPRMCVGLFAGYTMKFLSKYGSQKVALILAAAVGSLTNTTLVLSFIRIFAAHGATIAYHTTTQNLTHLLVGVAFTNGIPEVIVSMVLVPIISSILIKKIKK